ncbi:MAG: diguanylate cyclase [Pseudomonadota bacterium]
MFKSKITSLLIVASIIMMFLLIFIWMNGNKEVKQQSEIINSNKIIVHKMRLIADMTSIVRTRTRLTSKLLIVNDPFAKDDIFMELESLSSAFIRARLEFSNLKLSSFEQDMMKQQRKNIAVVVKNIPVLVEIAMSDDPLLLPKAQKLLYNEVFPGQGKVVDIFMAMLKQYESNIDLQTTQAQKSFNKNQKFRLQLLIASILFAFIGTALISRKIFLIEKNLHIEKQRTHITLMSIADAVLTINTQGVILDCNKVAENLLGLPANQLIGNKFSTAVTFLNEEKQGKNTYLDDDFLKQSLQNNNQPLTKNFQLRLNEKNEIIHIELLFSPIMEGASKAGCVITFRDVSAKKVLEQQLHQQAKYDALTGLLNRYSFEELCNTILTQYDKRQIYSLCVLDLDYFKNINDSCGHKSGDLVLKELAGIMKSTLREQDYLSRIGGDEFTIILSNCNEQNAAIIMQKIIDNISNYRFSYNNTRYSLGCSIGVTEIRCDDTSCSEVFKRADTGCYQAKNSGRNKVVLYSFPD